CTVMHGCGPGVGGIVNGQPAIMHWSETTATGWPPTVTRVLLGMIVTCPAEWGQVAVAPTWSSGPGTSHHLQGAVADADRGRRELDRRRPVGELDPARAQRDLHRRRGGRRPDLDRQPTGAGQARQRDRHAVALDDRHLLDGRRRRDLAGPPKAAAVDRE